MSPKEEMGARALQGLRHAQQDSLQQRQHPARTPRTCLHPFTQCWRSRSPRACGSKNWGKPARTGEKPARTGEKLASFLLEALLGSLAAQQSLAEPSPAH